MELIWAKVFGPNRCHSNPLQFSLSFLSEALNLCSVSELSHECIFYSFTRPNSLSLPFSPTRRTRFPRLQHQGIHQTTHHRCVSAKRLSVRPLFDFLRLFPRQVPARRRQTTGRRVLSLRPSAPQRHGTPASPFLVTVTSSITGFRVYASL